LVAAITDLHDLADQVPASSSSSSSDPAPSRTRSGGDNTKPATTPKAKASSSKARKKSSSKKSAKQAAPASPVKKHQQEAFKYFVDAVGPVKARAYQEFHKGHVLYDYELCHVPMQDIFCNVEEKNQFTDAGAGTLISQLLENVIADPNLFEIPVTSLDLAADSTVREVVNEENNALTILRAGYIKDNPIHVSPIPTHEEAWEYFNSEEKDAFVNDWLGYIKVQPASCKSWYIIDGKHRATVCTKHTKGEKVPIRQSLWEVDADGRPVDPYTKTVTNSTDRVPIDFQSAVFSQPSFKMWDPRASPAVRRKYADEINKSAEKGHTPTTWFQRCVQVRQQLAALRAARGEGGGGD
jgi:hypothetical protein